jgi:hypothetical protein
MFNNFSGKVAGEEHKLMLVCEKMRSNELSVITKYLLDQTMPYQESKSEGCG